MQSPLQLKKPTIGLILPEQNAHEAAIIGDLKIYGVSNIKQIIDSF
jgi:magnesium chelatase family protein